MTIMFDESMEKTFMQQVGQDVHQNRRAMVLARMLRMNGYIKLHDQSIATMADFDRDWVESLELEAWETNMRLSAPATRHLRREEYSYARERFMRRWLIGLIPKTEDPNVPAS